MYINTEILVSRGISLIELAVLQLAKQNGPSEDQSKALKKYSEEIKSLEERGLIDRVKKKQVKDADETTIRASKDGKKLIDLINTPLITEDDIALYDWIKNIYLSQNKDLGNQKRSKINLARFRVESGIDRKCLAYLIQSFVEDQNNMQYSHKLEYVFWKPANFHQTRFELEQSRLWDYYQRNSEHFDMKFKKFRGE